MVQHSTKQQFIAAITQSAALYINEFDAIDEADKDVHLEEGERTPYENLAYQLGWMNLIQQWEQQEKQGHTPEMPAPGIKWNNLGLLHQQFYAAYRAYTMQELRCLFSTKVEELCAWIDTLDDTALFQPGGRKWAQSSPSNWPVWKWVQVNTVAPCKSFRSKIRRWKRLKSAS